jgi:DNA-binding NarL/FixJ family response regulator
MIRIATFDRHPTVHAGVEAIVGAQPGVLHVGSAADRHELMRLLASERPDVVVLSHRPGRDGFELCLRIAAQPHAPRVLVFGAGMDAETIVPATLAGAAAIVATLDGRRKTRVTAQGLPPMIDRRRERILAA